MPLPPLLQKQGLKQERACPILKKALSRRACPDSVLFLRKKSPAALPPGGCVIWCAAKRKELVLNDRIIVVDKALRRVAVDFIIIHGLTIKGVITEVQRIFGEIIIADILKQDKDIFPGVHNIHGVILDLKGRGGAFSIV